MAIKVGGTTVIDDSRNLVNIVSGAGSSTAYGAIGTYATGRPNNQNAISVNTTHSGMRVFSQNHWQYNAYRGSTGNIGNGVDGGTLSGTWRCMAPCGNNGGDGHPGLFVRIS